jgi:hypothetical protein
MLAQMNTGKTGETEKVLMLERVLQYQLAFTINA